MSRIPDNPALPSFREPSSRDFRRSATDLSAFNRNSILRALGTRRVRLTECPVRTGQSIWLSCDHLVLITAQDRVRELILEAFAEFEATTEPSSSRPGRLARLGHFLGGLM